MLDEVEIEYKKHPPNTLLVVADIRDSFGTEKGIKRMQALGKTHPSKYFATLGVTGVKKLLGKMVKKEMYFADDMDDAKEWIVNKVEAGL